MNQQAYRANILHFLDDPDKVGERQSYEYFEDGLLIIEGGRISAMGEASQLLPKVRKDEIFNYEGKLMLPGLIDTQCHFREPGGEHKETIQTGTMSAALGGIVGIFEMPNTNPLTITPDAIADKLKRASRVAWTDYAFYLGGTGRTSSNLGEWENLEGTCGIKIFVGASTGDLITPSDEEIEAVISNGRRVIAVHAEDQYMICLLYTSPSPRDRG